MRWLRLYHDIIDDPKILRLPIGSRWFYICIMCVSSKQNARGTLPSLEELAIHLRVRRAKAKEIVDELIAAGLLDEDPSTKGLTVHGWHRRQPKSDDVTARVETFRQRRGNGGCNGDVTPRVRDTEIEIEKEKEKPPSIPPPRGDGKKSPFVLPDWIPAGEWREFEAMRAKIRKPMTDHARRLAVGMLADLREGGHDPAAVLQQSVFNSWQGLFEPKNGFGTKNEEVKYHVEPPDSPLREHERNVRSNLFAIFGGDGSSSPPQPGGGTELAGVVPNR